MLTLCFIGRRPRKRSRPTRNTFFQEFSATCQPFASGTPHVLRHLRLRHRSKADRLLDPRLSVLAHIHQLQSKELGVDINQMEAIGTPVPRAFWSCTVSHKHHGVGCQGKPKLPRVISPTNFKGLLPSPRRIFIHRGRGGQPPWILRLTDVQSHLPGASADHRTR